MTKFLTLCACAMFLGGSARAAALEEMFEKILPAGPNASLSIRNTDGMIYIFGSDEPVIKITVRKRAYSKARLDGIAIEIKAEGEAVSIDTIFPPNPKGLSAADRSGTVDYQVLVPQTCTLSQVELANGEIMIAGLRGRGANLRLTNGRMMVRNCFSDLQLAVANGSLEIFYDWWEPLPFSLAAKTEAAGILALLPQAAPVRIDAVSANGQVRNAFTKEGDTSATGARFQLRSGSGRIEIYPER